MNDQIEKRLTGVSSRMRQFYEEQQYSQEILKERLPDRQAVYDLIGKLEQLTFPDGMEKQRLLSRSEHIEELMASVYQDLYPQVKTALQFRKNEADLEAMDLRAQELTLQFIEQIPVIIELLQEDAEAQFQGDPAAGSIEEVVLSYPGIYTVLVYRYAHVLYQLGIPFLPRIMSEYAHGRTGIDINPGAEIGRSFFIDHGTGIVIGETTKIGNNVKIYQGVTLGALSTRKGQQLAGLKRHPTIEDNVIIYANATVLGGLTVIGKNSVIAGNSFIVESVPENTRAASTIPELQLASVHKK